LLETDSTISKSYFILYYSMIDLKYIVTGTGRCGTLYMANLLTTFGFPCSHEGIFTCEGRYKALEVVNGQSPVASSVISRGQNRSDYEMDIVADSSYMAAPLLSLFCSAKVIHVVRNPAEVIRSFIKKLDYFSSKCPEESEENPLKFKFEKFIYRSLPELGQEMSRTDKACLYYVRWNKMIENSGRVDYFHRMEDGVEGLKKFFNFEGEEYYREICNILPDKEDAYEPQMQNIQPWIKKELIDISRRYGYLKI